MARFVSGEVVVVPFPFTDLSSTKIRPALVLAVLTRGDIILCQITSQSVGHPAAIAIPAADFGPGGALRRDSFALPHRVVTANESCVRRAVGRLSATKLNSGAGAGLRCHPAGMMARRRHRPVFPASPRSRFGSHPRHLPPRPRARTVARRSPPVRCPA